MVLREIQINYLMVGLQTRQLIICSMLPLQSMYKKQGISVTFPANPYLIFFCLYLNQMNFRFCRLFLCFNSPLLAYSFISLQVQTSSEQIFERGQDFENWAVRIPLSCEFPPDGPQSILNAAEGEGQRWKDAIFYVSLTTPF